MDALRAATVEQIAGIDKMGLTKAQHVVDGLAAMSGVIDRLAAGGVTMRVPETAPNEKPLDGKTYVVSGSVAGYTRTTVNERIEQLGGRASGAVSAGTTALVTAETTTAKAKKAAKLGIPIIDPAQFAEMLTGQQPGPVAAVVGVKRRTVPQSLPKWGHPQPAGRVGIERVRDKAVGQHGPTAR
jgi:DNA ligase (NAD+)